MRGYGRLAAASYANRLSGRRMIWLVHTQAAPWLWLEVTIGNLVCANAWNDKLFVNYILRGQDYLRKRNLSHVEKRFRFWNTFLLRCDAALSLFSILFARTWADFVLSLY